MKCLEVIQDLGTTASVQKRNKKYGGRHMERARTALGCLKERKVSWLVGVQAEIIRPQ